jgi:hypothetical protein
MFEYLQWFYPNFGELLLQFQETVLENITVQNQKAASRCMHARHE